jgi:hypothetical protein
MSNDLEERLHAARAALPDPHASITDAAEARALSAFVSAEGGEKRSSGASRRGPWLIRLLVPVAVVLSLGIGIGLAVAPSGTKAAPFVAEGPGFLPAIGWNTLTTGAATPPQAPMTIAATVPFNAQDLRFGAGNLPAETIAGLPTDGILIMAIFYPRGESAKFDANFRPLSVPLSFEQAQRSVRPGEGQPHPDRIASYGISGAINSYNVSVTAYFGTLHPSPEERARASEEVKRLVVPKT